MRYLIILLLFLVCTAYAEDRDTTDISYLMLDSVGSAIIWEDVIVSDPSPKDSNYWEVVKIDAIVDTVRSDYIRDECECYTIPKRVVNPTHDRLSISIDTCQYYVCPYKCICVRHDTTYQRRLDRWTCRVDTNYLEQGTIGGMIVGTTTYDTTWIPLAPVFVDTTKIGVEIRNIRNIDTLDLPIPQRNLREWLNRQADKSFFEAVKQLIEEYEQ